MNLQNHGVLFFGIKAGWFHHPAFDFHAVVGGGPDHALNPRHFTLPHEVTVEVCQLQRLLARPH